MQTYNTIELQVINSCLLNCEHLYKLMQYDNTIFDNYYSKLLFDVLKDLHDTGQMIDLPSFVLAIEKANTKIDINNFITRISSLLPVNNIDYILRELLDKQYVEQIKCLAKDLYTSIQKGSIEFETFIEKISEIKSFRDIKTNDYIDLNNLGSLDEIFKKTRYIKTGFDLIDDKIAGLFNGQIIIIASRPGIGKTSLALQMAYNIDQPVFFFSLEMKREELYAKLLSMKTNVPSWKIEAKKLEKDEFNIILREHEKLKSKLKITLFDEGLNFSQIMSSIKSFYMIKKPGCIFIDYIQLIQGVNQGNRNEQLTHISRAFKLLAMQLNCPIVILSQLSRDIEKSNRTPVLSDLRDSGSLEQDASVVLFLHETEDDYSVFVGKNRKGKTGRIRGINFNKQFSRFEESRVDDELNLLYD